MLDAAGKKAEQLIEEALIDADESEPADGATADPQPVSKPLRDRRRELDTYTRRKRLDGRSAPQFPPRTRIQELAQSRRLQRPRTATLQRRPPKASSTRTPVTRPVSAQAKVSVGWVRPERDDEAALGIVEDDNEDGFEEAIHAWTGGFTMKASRGGVVALTQRPTSRREPTADTRVSQLVRELRARLLSKRGGRPVSQLFRLFDRRVRRKADPRDVYEGLRSLGIAATLGDAQGLVKAIARGKELRCADLAVFLDDPDFASLEDTVCAGAASRLLPPPPVTSYAQCDPTKHAIQQLRDLFGDSFVTRSTFAEGLRHLQLDRVAPDVVQRLTTAYDLNGDGRVHARAFVKTITKSQAWKRAAKARKRVLQVAREAEEAYDQVEESGYWPNELDDELVEACRSGFAVLTDTHVGAKRALQSELPPNWVRSHARDGRPFFHDLVSNTSTWDRPFAPEFVSLARDACRRRRRVVDDDEDALVVEDDSEEEEVDVERISRPKSADAVRRARVVVSPEVLQEAPPARVPRPASAPPRRLGPSPTPFLTPEKSASESESDAEDASDDAEEEASAEGAPDAEEEPEPEPAPATPPRKRPSTKVAQILADLQARVRLLETTTGRRARARTPDGVRGVARLARSTPQRTPSRTGPRARKSPLPGGHTGSAPGRAGRVPGQLAPTGRRGRVHKLTYSSPSAPGTGHHPVAVLRLVLAKTRKACHSATITTGGGPGAVPGRFDERLNVDQRTVAERHGRTQRRTAGES